MSPKQKIAPNCNFFAIRDRREFPRSQIKARKRSKMAILRLFSALRERRGVPNRKKVAKSSLFLFLRLADRRDGANPAKDESHTHRNQGIHLQSDKKTARRRFRSQLWLGQQDSRALRALFPLAQAPAGKSLKTCHRHVFFTGFHLIGSNPLHPARQQKPPEGGFVLKYMAGPAGFEPT